MSDAVSSFAAQARSLFAQVYDAGVRAGSDRRRAALQDRERAVDFGAGVVIAHFEVAIGKAHARAGQEAVDACETSDMAQIGKSLMEAIATIQASDSPYSDWAPADDPAEIVLDLFEDVMSLREGGATRAPEVAVDE